MKIKHTPEDFVVQETGQLQPSGNGPYCWFTLKKRGHTTLGALERIGRKLGVPLKAFGYAGSKDRQAVTTQTCSVKGKLITHLEIDGITADGLGQHERPVGLGTHTGNQFTITIRDLETLPTIPTRFLNLFGDQRFSTHNVAIGKAIVKKDFKTAIETILTAGCDEANAVRAALAEQPTNPIGALRHIPTRKLKLYVHAYQSDIWNRCARKANDEKILPIVGFGSEDLPWIVEEELHYEGITTRDFLIRELPDLSAEGGERDVWCEPKDVNVGELTEDECFSGKKKLTLSFWLPKGSYATTYIEQFGF